MSVRQIILLRHAHAEPASGDETDLSRPLTANGAREAQAAGDWLKTHGAQPDVVLCSPSARTRETAAQVLARLAGGKETSIDTRIYEATPGALIEVLEEHADADCVLLVGHNPGLRKPHRWSSTPPPVHPPPAHRGRRISATRRIARRLPALPGGV